MVSCICFFFQAEDGIRDLVRSRGLGDVYKRQTAEYRELLADASIDAISITTHWQDHYEVAAAALALSLIHI